MRRINLIDSRGATSDLVLICTQNDGAIEFSLHGELDLANAEHFEHAVTRVIRARLDRIFLDIGALTFLDSRGIAALLLIKDRCDAAGTELVVLGVPSRQVTRILMLAGVDEWLGAVTGRTPQPFWR